MNRFAARLQKLECSAHTPPAINVVIYTMWRRGADGPETTGEAMAKFVQRQNLPMLRKPQSEATESFNARVNDIVSRIEAIKALPTEQADAEEELLVAEIKAANNDAIAFVEVGR